MKRILLAFLICFSPFIGAQNFENLWDDHFSYVSVKDISQGDDRILLAQITPFSLRSIYRTTHNII